MYFLVCREDLLRPNNYVRSSDHFPMVVEVIPNKHHSENFHEVALCIALDSVSEGYNPGYSYLVAPLHGASVISLRKPVSVYEKVTESYDEFASKKRPRYDY